MGRLLSRWLSPYVLYIIIGALAVFLFWFAQQNLTVDVDTNRLTLNNPIIISAVAIVIGVLFNGAVKLHSEMRDRAFTLILTNRQDKAYMDAIVFVNEFFRNNTNLSADAIAAMYKSKEENDKNLCKNIRLVGNFYEDMAISIKYKEVNEPIIEEYFIGIFIRFYEKIEDFLPEMRRVWPPDTASRIEVFCELDELYRKWKPKHLRLIKRLEKRAALKAKIKSLILTN